MKSKEKKKRKKIWNEQAGGKRQSFQKTQVETRRISQYEFSTWRWDYSIMVQNTKPWKNVAGLRTMKISEKIFVILLIPRILQ